MATQIRPDATTLDAARRYLAILDKDYDIAAAYLFGSRARGDHHEDSDADLAIILNGPKGTANTISTMLKMVNPAYDVFLETWIDISPMPIWLEDWEQPERHSNPGLIENIKDEGIAVL